MAAVGVIQAPYRRYSACKLFVAAIVRKIDSYGTLFLEKVSGDALEWTKILVSISEEKLESVARGEASFFKSSLWSCLTIQKLKGGFKKI